MYIKIILEVFGGLALFIFGVNRLSISLQRITSNKLKSVINVLTKKSWSTLLVGVFATMTIQSSSLTSVMTVGFVNAGLITLRQAIGIIMGANIGTTVTAQLVSFRIDMFAFPIIIVGFALYFISKKRKYKNIGMAILGFGLLFLGMTIMKTAMSPLREVEGFKNFLLLFSQNPFLGILAGLILTVILQSSSATIGLLIALASQGLVPIEAAIPILIGDNIGTCSTAMISSLGTTVTAKRTALSHFLFNVVGAVIFVLLFYVLRVGPYIVNISGTSLTRQIANIHTFFNVITTLVLFPIIGFFEKVVVKIFPGKDITINKNALHINKSLIQTPDIALDQVRKELLRLSKISKEMLNLSYERLHNKDVIIEKKLLDRETAVDSITEEIINFLTKISQKSLNFTLSNRLTHLLHIAYDVERTADHAESILYLSMVKEENNLVFSDIEKKELKTIFERVNHLFDKLIFGLDKDDSYYRKECEDIEAEIDELVLKSRANHLIRLRKGECMPPSGVIFSDIVMHFERIGDLLYGISKNIVY
jgi:phosphate:Na+ symporter